jgi:hypothetical protein
MVARLKVPHMGWNRIRIERQAPIFKDIPDGGFFYFVHSYYVVPDDEGIIAATTEYGRRFTSILWRDNLFACQFNMHKVSRHALTPEGASFKSRDEDFVVSKNLDFHPTDVLEDADGSLVIVDTGGWYKLCCPTSQLWKPDILGAIYRVLKTGVERW